MTNQSIRQCCVEGKPAWGAIGQGALMKDIHCSLLRLMEGIDQEVQEAPTLAGYGSAADLSPHEAYRCALHVPSRALEGPELCIISRLSLLPKMSRPESTTVRHTSLMISTRLSCFLLEPEGHCSLNAKCCEEDLERYARL